MKVQSTNQSSQSENNWNEVYQMISWWDAEKTRQAKIMVVGAGALGNEVLKNLALLNIGYIFLVDFDTIEYSNLSRSVLYRSTDIGQKKADVAAQRIREINPNVTVQTVNGDIIIDIGLGVFRRMDVVIGCLDNRIARLYINRHCFKVGKVWVDGAIENLAGQLVVYKPEISCYECQLTERENALIAYRLGCPDVAQRNANFGRIPTTPISASIIGAMQTQEALKVVFGNDRNLMAGLRFQYEGMNNMMLQYKGDPLKEECASHSKLSDIVEAKDLSCTMSIKSLLSYLKNKFNTPSIRVLMPDEIVLEITTKVSEVTSELVILRGHLSEDIANKYRQIVSEDIIITKSTNIVDDKFPHQDLSLKAIGIPPLQILPVETPRQYLLCGINWG